MARHSRATRGPRDPKVIPSHGVLRGHDKHLAVFVAAVIDRVNWSPEGTAMSVFGLMQYALPPPASPAWSHRAAVAAVIRIDDIALL